MYHIIILCLRNYNTNSILYNMTRFKMVMIDIYIVSHILYNIGFWVYWYTGLGSLVNLVSHKQTDRQTEHQITVTLRSTYIRGQELTIFIEERLSLWLLCCYYVSYYIKLLFIVLAQIHVVLWNAPLINWWFQPLFSLALCHT